MSSPDVPLCTSASPEVVQGQFDVSINLLIIGTAFLAFLVAITIALFFFSDSQLRRKPIFILNVLAILLGYAHASVGIYSLARILSGREVNPGIFMASTCLYFFIPISVQSILLVRIVAVYPPRYLSRISFILIYGTFSSLIVARVINAALCWKDLIQKTHGLSDPWASVAVSWSAPYAKAEWFMQLIFDVVASSLFLWRLYSGGAVKRVRTTWNISGISNRGVDRPGSRWSYAARLRALFWIALSNFIIPVIFNIALLALSFDESKVEVGSYVVWVNTYVEIISVLLATLWCSSTHWQAVEDPESAGGEKPLDFANVTTRTMESMKFASPIDLTTSPSETTVHA